MLANLTQYGLEHRYLDIIVGDSSLPLWREGFKLDAIITDRECNLYQVFKFVQHS